jgi:hypothetical protein
MARHGRTVVAPNAHSVVPRHTLQTTGTGFLIRRVDSAPSSHPRCVARLAPRDDWLRVPSAQFRYDPRTQVWTLHWIDGDSIWHIVQVMPTFEITELLAEVEGDPYCLFFG